jgi:ABC-type antimicrobial peptide transport system permease subunit
MVLRSLLFHWRAHLGALFGATLATAILVGALAVGDSVRFSLRELALARLGGVHLALNASGTFFREQLASDVAKDIQTTVAPVALLRGTASTESSTAGSVQVIGVDSRFWSLAPSPDSAPPLPDSGEGVALNAELARKLNVKIGNDVLLRVDKPGLLSRDAPLSTLEDATVALRLPVTAILNEGQFGRFSLAANQIPPMNAFVPLRLLQQKIGMRDRANVLLTGAIAREADPRVASEEATQSLWSHWKLEDANLELRELPRDRILELRTDRVFLDTTIGGSAIRATGDAKGVLTYFVNSLSVGNRSTPYSTVSAIQSDLLPPDMGEDDILINRWLAEDIQARVGDRLKLRYWVVGSKRRLEERTFEFRVRAILPMAGKAIDPDLMPNIPGLADKKDCREWEPGVPIDLNKLRDKDQDYWSRYRGTPKAFIKLSRGQIMWDNRFGNLTAVRYPIAGEHTRSQIEATLRQTINPAALGLFFTSTRQQAMAASSQSLDFGQLFLGFSFFLIVAALLLTALLFGFGAAQRTEEAGILLAIGWTPPQVRRLFLLEGGAIALLSSLLGAFTGAFYTQAVIYGLSTIWKGAITSAPLRFHAQPTTLVTGAVIGFLVSLCSIWFVTRRQAGASVRSLLAEEADMPPRPTASVSRQKSGLPGLPLMIGSLAGASLMMMAAFLNSGDSGTAFFFIGGALLLIGGLSTARLLLAKLERETGAKKLSLLSLGFRGIARRPGRSLSVIGLLASGCFLVFAVGANRHDPSERAEERSSGTGGFAYYMETTLPVFQDLNSMEGQESFTLDHDLMKQVKVVAIRLQDGDEASCLNLNRAQAPRLFGVAPSELMERKAFTFIQTAGRPEVNGQRESGWGMLDDQYRDETIPVVGDMNTVVWSLGKKVGDTFLYTDGRGRSQKLKIVGMISNSLFQGGLVMSEAHFVRMFPNHSGYQVFLIDADAAIRQKAQQELSRGLRDIGPDITPSAERLATFQTVENTYLSIFAVLGGLGMLLGSAGLAAVVLRNALERRGEFAVLRAIGFSISSLHRLLFHEHLILLTLGLLIGLLSALVATLPALRSPGAEAPVLSLGFTLLLIFVSGLLWTWLATTLALRGSLLSALRRE